MTDSVSTRVVFAIAEERGVDPAELPPLNDVVDTDALDALFDPDGSRGDRRDRELRFSYAGRDVRVRNGVVTVGQTGQRSESPAHD